MKTLSKAAILMVALVAIFFVTWELYLRSIGVNASYDEGKELWANSRAQVYESPDKTTVFVGSSRIKYDLDVDTWRKETGRNAVQLAMEGNSPLPMMEDLAADPKFKGLVVCDVMEFVLFGGPHSRVRRQQKELIDYYWNETPAQRASFVLNHALESQFALLDRDFFSLNGLLGTARIPNRPGFHGGPLFPWSFHRVTIDRQTKMAPRFLADTNLQNQVKDIWAGKGMPPPDTTGDAEARVDIMRRMVAAVAKIRSRGGDVTFVRPPSSGASEPIEMMLVPREKFWQPLLDATHSTGVYYKDDPAQTHFICPEWSHLSPSDAVLYTRALIRKLPPEYVKRPI